MSTFNYNDKAGLLYVITKLKTIFGDYVEKETGKALSTNDFSDELKAKLDGIAENATKVIVDAALSGTSENAIQNKAVFEELEKKANLAGAAFTGMVTLPTATAGTNDTTAATCAFVTAAISTAIAGITGMKFEKVASFNDLPEIGSLGVIYLVPKSTTAAHNIYTEYYWSGNETEGTYEILGDTTVDLTNYVQVTDMVAISNAEIDAMFSAAGF